MSLPRSKLILGVFRDQLHEHSDRAARLEKSITNGKFTTSFLSLLALVFFVAAGSGFEDWQAAAAMLFALGAAITLAHLHACDTNYRQTVREIEMLEERLDRIGIGVRWQSEVGDRQLEVSVRPRDSQRGDPISG